MNNFFAMEFENELQNFLALCEEAFALAARENQALAGADYQSCAFLQKRKSLLPNLDLALIQLRKLRTFWQQAVRSERGHREELQSLVQRIQDLLMKMLLLDNENQQAMLRRGLVPPAHLQSVAGKTQHYAANIYRRHSPI